MQRQHWAKLCDGHEAELQILLYQVVYLSAEVKQVKSKMSLTV